MKLMQSIFILIMVGWGMVLAVADTPQVDPKILDVLYKVEAQINSSEYLSYHVERKQTRVDSDRKSWVTSGTAWLRRVPSDTFFGAYFHLQGKDEYGDFDYFYDGKESRQALHKYGKVTIYRPGDFPDTPNHPAKARMSTVVFQPLLFDTHFSKSVLENCKTALLQDDAGESLWTITVRDNPNQNGMDTTNTYQIDKRTYRIKRTEMLLVWRGTRTETTLDFSDYHADKETIERRIPMPLDFGSDYVTEVHQKVRSTQPAAYEKLIGHPAPDFSYPSFSGETISLENLKGKIVVLDFWESWCGWCKQALPDVSRLQQKWGERIAVIGVVSENRKEVQNVLDDCKIVYKTIFADPQMVRDYGVNGRPTYFLIGSDGKVVTAFAGNLAPIEAAIEKLLGKESD